MTEIQKSFERLINLAIQREVEAYEFYMKAAEQAELTSSAELLRELARQEEGHKRKLERALSEGVVTTFGDVSNAEEAITVLDRYLVDVPLRPDSSPQDILVVAIKREQNAQAFYQRLAEMVSHPGHKAVFETLAHEEQTHKERLERIYDDIFQPDL